MLTDQSSSGLLITKKPIQISLSSNPRLEVVTVAIYECKISGVFSYGVGDLIDFMAFVDRVHPSHA